MMRLDYSRLLEKLDKLCLVAWKLIKIISVFLQVFFNFGKRFLICQLKNKHNSIFLKITQFLRGFKRI